MNKKQIRKRYEALVGRIEQMQVYDGRGKGVDIYECEKCGSMIFTRYKDKGVTPYFMRCRKCNGDAPHTHTISEPFAEVLCYQYGYEIRNWVRPTLEQLMKMNEATQCHVLDGGLVLEEEEQA